VSQERRIEIVAREDNANGARGQCSHGWLPITTELVRPHSDYMHCEYGERDSDYVFVNLWGASGAMTYASVHEIVARTRRAVDLHFTPHQFRDTYATVVRRGGVPLEIVSKLLCHRSVQTTSHIYLHATAEDLRPELERAGVLERLEALT
jgi:integrase/recombinase XerD